MKGMVDGVPFGKLRTMDDVPLDGRRVLVRVDFNVSAGPDGSIGDHEDYRIEAALPTIEELQQRRCRVILLTHRGRPNIDGKDFALEPVIQRLEELLRGEVVRLKNFSGSGVDTVIAGLEPGAVAMMPNIRLDQREMVGSEKLATELATVADVYVNEAFSVCHRAHTSVAFLPYHLPSAAGRRTVREVEVLARIRDNPDRPYVAIASGAKITTKIGMLRTLLNKVDTLCVGGQIANVFLAAQGKHSVAHFNANDIAAAQSLLTKAGTKLLLPVDVVVGSADGRQGVRTLAVGQAAADATNFWDIGPRSVANIIAACQRAKTVLWNGPVGLFEVPAYEQATMELARRLAGLVAYRVVGGGDTIIALERSGVVSKYNHVSVGGGALMAFLEGKRLPGLEPLYE